MIEDLNVVNDQLTWFVRIDEYTEKGQVISLFQAICHVRNNFEFPSPTDALC